MKTFYAAHSLKGTIESVQAADIACSVLNNAVIIPVSDGGDGFADVMAYSRKGGRFIKVRTVNANGNTVNASYYSHMENAYIESADVIGLKRIKADTPVTERNSRGLGIVLKHAMQKHRRVFVGLGGSATIDMGIGMLREMGSSIETEGNTLIMKNINIKNKLNTVHVICDVRNPLEGKYGAVVYAKQKGASKPEIKVLGKAFNNAALITGMQNTMHAGAAGGLGFAFMLAGAHVKDNMDFMMNELHLMKHMKACNVFVTSEGQIDNQSFSGKITGNLIELALRMNKRVIVITAMNRTKRHDFETVILKKSGNGVQNRKTFIEGLKELKRRVNG